MLGNEFRKIRYQISILNTMESKIFFVTNIQKDSDHVILL